MTNTGTLKRRTWNDPKTCPFCGTGIANGGPAFMDHIDINDACWSSFDVWRQNVAGDVGGEWSG